MWPKARIGSSTFKPELRLAGLLSAFQEPLHDRLLDAWRRMGHARHITPITAPPADALATEIDFVCWTGWRSPVAFRQTNCAKSWESRCNGELIEHLDPDDSPV